MNQTPASVILSLALLYLTAFFWFSFAVLTIGNLIPSIPAGPVRWVMGILAFGCSIFLASLTFFLSRQNRLAYKGLIGLLVFILIASFMDELGWSDAILIAICLTAFGLLLKDRAWYLNADNIGGKT